MQLGETLLAGTSLFTEWLDREADNAIFTYEAIYVFGSAVLDVEVYTKNSEDTGPGTKITAITKTTSGRFTKLKITGNNLKEMLRFKIVVTGDPIGGQLLAPTPCTDAEELDISILAVSYAVYRFLETTWFDKA